MGNILETIKAANEGKLIDGLGKACGISKAQAGHALDKLVPAIASKILAKSNNDPDDYQDLIEIVDDEEQVNYLTKPSWSFSIAAIEDGQDILSHLFGSVSDAIASELQLEHDDATNARLANFSATFCVAAMASRNQALFFTNEPENDDEPSGLWAMLVAALLKGLMQSLARKRPRRRYRRRTYGRRKTRKRRSSKRASKQATRKRKSTTTRRRRRRKKSPSLNDLIGDLFRG